MIMVQSLRKRFVKYYTGRIEKRERERERTVNRLNEFSYKEGKLQA